MSSPHHHRAQRPHPIHPDRLLHSAWSVAEARQQEMEHCHWEVITHLKRRGEVVLRATLDERCTITIPWRELRDRERWTPGWR